MPAVSVVLPVRNGAATLAQALTSILAQTLTDFELIAFISGHTIEFAQPATGLVPALNRGVTEARAPLIARMDADDIAKPERLARQVQAMAAHPTAAVIGTAIEIIDSSGRILRTESRPHSAGAISAALAQANCIAHPTVMMRRAAAREAGLYRPAFLQAEDYDLWLRIAERHDLLNLAAPLLQYRDHAAQLTWQNLEQRILSELAARAAAARRRAGQPDGMDTPAPVTRATLRELGMTEPDIARSIRARAIGATIDALAAGHRQAAREALALARRQGKMPTRTRAKTLLLQARLGLP